MLAALLTAYIAVFIADVDVGNKTEFVLNFIPMLRQIVGRLKIISIIRKHRKTNHAPEFE